MPIFWSKNSAKILKKSQHRSLVGNVTVVSTYLHSRNYNVALRKFSYVQFYHLIHVYNFII
jgi:ribosomal protein S12